MLQLQKKREHKKTLGFSFRHKLRNRSARMIGRGFAAYERGSVADGRYSIRVLPAVQPPDVKKPKRKIFGFFRRFFGGKA